MMTKHIKFIRTFEDLSRESIQIYLFIGKFKKAKKSSENRYNQIHINYF